MSNLPITSRLKRAPGKYSPYKQTEKDATVGGAGGTIETKVITDSKKGKDGSGTGAGGACSGPNPPKGCKDKFRNPAVPGQTKAEFDAAACGSPGKPFGTKNCPDKGPDSQKGKETCADGSAPDANGKCTETKTEKTEGWDGNLKTGTQARVLQPWEINRLSRGVKSTTRKVNLARKRLDKLGAIADADGNYSLPDGASSKDQRRFEKQQARLKQFRAQVKNSETAIESGRGAGELVRSGQRNTGQDEQTRKQQIEQLKRETAKANAEKAALENQKNEAAIKDGIVTSGSGTASGGQAEGAIGIPAASATGTPVPPVPGEPAGTVESGKYVDPNSMAKSRSAYKMRSKNPSILKLTAAQGKLPQVIQDAIVSKEKGQSKAPNKFVAGGGKGVASRVASGFKMKGYGKR